MPLARPILKSSIPSTYSVAITAARASAILGDRLPIISTPEAKADVQTVLTQYRTAALDQRPPLATKTITSIPVAETRQVSPYSAPLAIRPAAATPTTVPGTTGWKRHARAGTSEAEGTEVTPTEVQVAEVAQAQAAINPIRILPSQPSVASNTEIVQAGIQDLVKSSASAAYGGGSISMRRATVAADTAPMNETVPGIIESNKAASHEAIVRQAAEAAEIRQQEAEKQPLFSAKAVVAPLRTISVADATKSSNTDYRSIPAVKLQRKVAAAMEPTAPQGQYPYPGDAIDLIPDDLADEASRYLDPSFFQKNKKLITYAAVGVGVLLLLKR